jgi:hypothetical protein
MRPIDHVTVAGTDLCRIVAADTVVGIETVYGGGHRGGSIGRRCSQSAGVAVSGPAPMADRGPGWQLDVARKGLC